MSFGVLASKVETPLSNAFKKAQKSVKDKSK